jgi:(S)-3,5-dihydroxyphenylglycine transaminase
MTTRSKGESALPAQGSRLTVMNFLNEVGADFPQAISFASGRPAEAFFRLDDWLSAIPRYLEHFGRGRGLKMSAAATLLAQYGRTAGMINELVAAQLRRDEGLHCAPEQVLITAGCQEALALCLGALCRDADDVVLARNPTYIGVTGVADLAGIELQPLLDGGGPGWMEGLRATVARLKTRGKRARALYLIPEFDNPTGNLMPAADRAEILEFCAEHRIVVLEDNPYGMFRFEGPRLPPLAAVDTRGTVIYLGTYSKTLCPAVRVGCAVLPATLFGDAAAARALYADLAERKSFATVNTSQLNQALVGGVLLDQGLSLGELIRAPLAHYRRNRDVLVEELSRAFGGLQPEIAWNCPQGGFFLSLSLPFEFGQQEVLDCARDFQVIPMPMQFFALDGSCRQQVRLAFSNQDPASIALGVERLARFVFERLERQARAAASAPIASRATLFPLEHSTP